MLLIDANVLVYAHRRDATNHRIYRNWLEDLVSSDQAYGISDFVLSSFLRIVTHPRIFSPPSVLRAALHFAGEVRGQPNCVRVMPGPRHWEIFVGLCHKAGAIGNLVPDAYLAALVIESGSEWITTDRDYSRFPGLRWRHPLE
ncbi:MAG: type II toxin-antitoxin system VapC family toxin [Acidobacteria bacterium]|nr:type II toxin-antitoxin system VapC family toxin [Acidobacteriota bacterium]